MMLKLRTEIERTPLRQLIGCREGVLLLGSCFTDHIGTWMGEHWLKVLCNPWGVLFNPASIAQSLQRVLSDNRTDSPFELQALNGRYYSFAHHGKWSDTDADVLQQKLVALDAEVRTFWNEACHVIITLGTSWVYEREGRIVVGLGNRDVLVSHSQTKQGCLYLWTTAHSLRIDGIGGRDWRVDSEECRLC